jgi:hypothetical protein
MPPSGGSTPISLDAGLHLEHLAGEMAGRADAVRPEVELSRVRLCAARRAKTDSGTLSLDGLSPIGAGPRPVLDVAPT